VKTLSVILFNNNIIFNIPTVKRKYQLGIDLHACLKKKCFQSIFIFIAGMFSNSLTPIFIITN